MSNLSRLLVIVVMLLLAVAVGVGVYQAGVAQGIAQSGKIIVPPPGPYPYPYPYYGWPGPWHFGFFGPFLFFAFWFLVIRGLFWRRRAWYGGGCGPYGRLDEWHRKAHGREAEAPAAGGGGER